MLLLLFPQPNWNSKICMRAIKSRVSFFFFFLPVVIILEIIKLPLFVQITTIKYECHHAWSVFFGIVQSFFSPTCKDLRKPNNLCIEKKREMDCCGQWKKKKISSGVLQALGSTPMTSLSAGCFKAEREERKTLDNHQCLQYLSSKRLKAHIAYNWIWFALPASVREIKGKHKNPHDSFSSRWQARPNRSWKEYLWWKPSSCLLAQKLLEMTVPGNNENIIKTYYYRCLKDLFDLFPCIKVGRKSAARYLDDEGRGEKKLYENSSTTSNLKNKAKQ